jgi:hypothetical protein
MRKGYSRASLALAFTPKLNLAFKRRISYERDKNGRLVSDGSLTIYRKNSVLPVADTADDIGGEASTLYAILDRTLKLNVPIHVFITGDLSLYTAIMRKEGMDKAHCHWCKLRSSQWQVLGHAPDTKWTFQELKRVAASLKKTNEDRQRMDSKATHS